MCDDKRKCNDPYNYFPPITIGGPTGDYFVECPVTSGRWVEFAVVAIANGDVGVGAVVVSGDSKPVALNYTGGNTLSDETYLRGIAYRLGASTTLIGDSDAFYRVTHSQKRVFVRIDAGTSNSMYVTLQFRIKPLDRIPGPSVTVHPDHAHQMNIAREDKTIERLTHMGVIHPEQKGA